MSPGERKLRNRRRLDWEPTEPIIADSIKSEPTKPSKPGFVGFEGSSLGGIVKIEGEQEPLSP